MNDTIKKFSDDLLADFKKALEKQKTAEVLSKIKAADAGTFSVVISTSDEDRQGDALDQSKWKLQNYEANPVVLWAHDYYNLPIGVCTSISVQDGKLVAEGKFASADLNPFADQVAKLYAAGYIKATSVGYIQHEDGELELLEFSFVPVPANPYALSMREMKKLNLNMPQLVMKGLQFTVKAEKPGDTCQLDDGTPGVLATDPENPGELRCVPEKDKSADDDQNNLVKSIKAEHERHGKAVTKAIEEFKGIDEFKSALDSENDDHLNKCMKAIDENYELEDQRKPTKAIDEFKSAMKAEHTEHVKCFGKAIEEFKSIEEFGKKATDELNRHEKAHVDLCEKEMGEGEDDETKAALTDLVTKVGRQISAKNRAKIEGVIKAIEEYKSAQSTAHEQHSNNVIAALKELMGDEGEEAGKSGSPNSRSRSTGAAPSVTPKDGTMSEFEAFMLVRNILKTVNSDSSEGLAKIKPVFREKFPDFR
jgi:hypothetical protein